MEKLGGQLEYAAARRPLWDDRRVVQRSVVHKMRQMSASVSPVDAPRSTVLVTVSTTVASTLYPKRAHALVATFICEKEREICKCE